MRSAQAEVRAGLLIALVLALTVGCSQTYTAPPPKAQASAAPESAAAATVLRLERAWRRADAVVSRGIGATSEAATQLADAAGNIDKLRIGGLDLRYLSSTGATNRDGSWAARVEVVWKIRGYDADPARLEIALGFSADGTSITALGGPGSAVPVWLAGRVEVARSRDTLVFGQGSARQIARIATRAVEAIRETQAVVKRAGKVVIELPDSTAALHRALGAQPPSYSAVAAVTAPVDGSIVASAPVHVFLNPSVYDKLDRIASQVVMTHEVVHAVTGAATVSGVPLWLIEGFADYVALDGVALPLSRTAAQISRLVRKEGPPQGLPADSDLSTTADRLGAEYEAAWLVCVVLAERGGRDALRTFYESVLGGADLGAALKDGFGWSTAELTAAWQQRLSAIADLSQ